VDAADVIELCQVLDGAHVAVWLDGGWGVDALLGEQTRRHADVDIVVEDRDVPRLTAVLAERGFHRRDGGRPWNFVVVDAGGREVDVHAVTFDGAGNGLYGPQEVDARMYPAASLTGTGTVAGRPVRCVTAGFQVASHAGYDLRPVDVADLAALRAGFGLIPELR